MMGHTQQLLVEGHAHGMEELDSGYMLIHLNPSLSLMCSNKSHHIRNNNLLNSTIRSNKRYKHQQRKNFD